MLMNDALFIAYTMLNSKDAEILDPIFARAIITILKAHKEEIIKGIIERHKQYIEDPFYKTMSQYFLKTTDNKEVSEDTIRKEVDKLLSND